MSEESAAVTRVISRDLADEWDVAYDAPGQLATERLEEHRWYVRKRVIFTAPDDGQIWAAEYCEGLSELQEDTDPWAGQQEVTLTRYESYEKTVTAWRPVTTASGGDGA